jgi:hypothetical protein
MNLRPFLSPMLAAALAACGSADAPAESPDPFTATGEAGLFEFELQLDDGAAVGALDGDILIMRDGAPVTGAEVWVTASMSSHTHGMSDARAEEAGDGRYRLTGLDVSMAGEWQVEIDALATGAEDTAVFEVYVE